MSEPDEELFMLRWSHPTGDAVMPVLCEECGATRYSSAENLAAARQRKMRIACLRCANRLLAEHGGEVGGSIRKGTVIQWSK
jgi:ribosomal protein S27E